jgi:predicted DNA-binding protein with PD1-like motif
MEVYEKKAGRVFRMEFTKGEDLLAEINNFARKQKIKEASLLVVGASMDGQITTGFISMEQSARRGLGQKREFFGLGNLTWPVKRPAFMPKDPGDEPQPYPHLHLTFGPDVGEEQKEILVGHLHNGLAFGATVILQELL